MFSENIVN